MTWQIHSRNDEVWESDKIPFTSNTARTWTAKDHKVFQRKERFATTPILGIVFSQWQELLKSWGLKIKLLYI
jgi:hypothetical protein